MGKRGRTPTPKPAPPLFLSEHHKKRRIVRALVEKGVKRLKRVTIKLTEEQYEEVRKLAGGRISA